MSTDEERIYSIALTQIPGVGHIGAKRLVDGMGSATDVFRYRTELPDRLPGVNRAVVAALDSPQALKRAEQEYEFARPGNVVEYIIFRVSQYACKNPGGQTFRLVVCHSFR